MSPRHKRKKVVNQFRISTFFGVVFARSVNEKAPGDLCIFPQLSLKERKQSARAPTATGEAPVLPGANQGCEMVCPLTTKRADLCLKSVVSGINAISSAAMTKKHHGAPCISTDRKNRPFLGRFGRKTGLRAKENRVCFRVFAYFEDFLRCKLLQGRNYHWQRSLKKNHAKKPTVGFLVFGTSGKILIVRIEKCTDSIVEKWLRVHASTETEQIMGGPLCGLSRPTVGEGWRPFAVPCVIR